MDVRRRHILTDKWRGFQRNHFTGTNPLKVHFVGEGADDDNRTRREYLNPVMHELLDSHLFVSSGQTKLPAPNTKDVMEKNSLCWTHYSDSACCVLTKEIYSLECVCIRGTNNHRACAYLTYLVPNTSPSPPNAEREVLLHRRHKPPHKKKTKKIKQPHHKISTYD